jgi:hypothetical protein
LRGYSQFKTYVNPWLDSECAVAGAAMADSEECGATQDRKREDTHMTEISF